MQTTIKMLALNGSETDLKQGATQNAPPAPRAGGCSSLSIQSPIGGQQPPTSQSLGGAGWNGPPALVSSLFQAVSDPLISPIVGNKNKDGTRHVGSFSSSDNNLFRLPLLHTHPQISFVNEHASV